MKFAYAGSITNSVESLIQELSKYYPEVKDNKEFRERMEMGVHIELIKIGIVTAGIIKEDE